MGKVYVGDTGTEIVLFCVSDISTAVNPTIAVRKPDGTEATWPAERNGAALTYFTQANDLNVPGRYLLQAQPNLPSWSGRGETAVLQVYDPFAL